MAELVEKGLGSARLGVIPWSRWCQVGITEMLGPPVGPQDRLFYEFCLENLVPADHLWRQIGAVLDLSWLRRELKPHYSDIGRPSICPELMIRMLLVGYCYSIRSERRLCGEVKIKRKRDPLAPSAALNPWGQLSCSARPRPNRIRPLQRGIREL